MTTNKLTDMVTSGGSLGNANIETQTGQTANYAIVGNEFDSRNLVKEQSEITMGEMACTLRSSNIRFSEYDAVMAKFRAAQASALFDPEAIGLLESLTKKPLFEFGELAENLTTEMWIKLAILVRAYLVEPLENGVRVTPEGSQALQKVSNYLARLDTENQEIEKGL